MKHITALAFCLTATVASAEFCTGDDLKLIPEMEAAKDAVFEGKYETFGRMLGSDFQGLPENATEMFAPFRELIADGYASCSTILQRHELPGFYQDVVIYTDEEFEGPVALLLIGAYVDGEFRFLEFALNTSFSEVVAGLR